MLRRLSVTSMVMSFKAGRFESAGARRVAKVVTAVEPAVVARTASTVANLVTCQETARNPRNQESLVVVAVAVAVTASTAASPAICHVNVRNPRNPESLVVAVVAAAVTASTVVSLVICLATVISLRSLESLRDLGADQAGEIEIQTSFLVEHESSE